MLLLSTFYFKNIVVLTGNLSALIGISRMTERLGDLSGKVKAHLWVMRNVPSILGHFTACTSLQMLELQCSYIHLLRNQQVSKSKEINQLI